MLFRLSQKSKESRKKGGRNDFCQCGSCYSCRILCTSTDRNMNYEIALDLPKANFDFYAGGGFLKPTTTYDKKEAPSIFPILKRQDIQ